MIFFYCFYYRTHNSRNHPENVNYQLKRSRELCFTLFMSDVIYELLTTFSVYKRFPGNFFMTHRFARGYLSVKLKHLRLIKLENQRTFFSWHSARLNCFFSFPHLTFFSRQNRWNLLLIGENVRQKGCQRQDFRGLSAC